jgi:hypothetical protein
LKLKQLWFRHTRCADGKTPEAEIQSTKASILVPMGA